MHGIVLTYRMLVAHTSLDYCSTKENIGLEPGIDVLIAVLPFFHIYGQVVALLTGLSGGGKVVSVPKFEPELYLNTVQTYRVSVPVHLTSCLHWFSGDWTSCMLFA